MQFINFYEFFLSFFCVQSLFVMQGIFCLRDEDGENEVLPCSEVTIPKGASYELKNCGEGIGIIQFTYVAEY